MDIVWKDTIGYEGIYEVSNTGLVRTHENKVTYTEKHGVRKWKQRILKQKIHHKDKTCRVSLWKDGKEKTWLVHRIVALAFIPLVEGKDYINHIDGSRLNNCVDNLEWCNHQENNNHAFDNGLIKTSHSVVLYNKTTKEMHYFRSKAKASEFLVGNTRLISGLLTKGKKEYKDYIIL